MQKPLCSYTLGQEYSNPGQPVLCNLAHGAPQGSCEELWGLWFCRPDQVPRVAQGLILASRGQAGPRILIPASRGWCRALEPDSSQLGAAWSPALLPPGQDQASYTATPPPTPSQDWALAGWKWHKTWGLILACRSDMGPDPAHGLAQCHASGLWCPKKVSTAALENEQR